MNEPRRVPFDELPRTDDAPGVRARGAEVGGARWVPSASRGAGAHRGRNPSDAPTGLFLVDDA